MVEKTIRIDQSESILRVAADRKEAELPQDSGPHRYHGDYRLESGLGKFTCEGVEFLLSGTSELFGCRLRILI